MVATPLNGLLTVHPVGIAMLVILFLLRWPF